MLKLSECKLVYSDKVNQNGIIVDIESILGPFPIRIGDVFSNKYYSNLIKGRQLDLFAIINKHHFNSSDKTLNYVLIDNKKYIVERVSNYQELMLQLDLSEEK